MTERNLTPDQPVGARPLGPPAKKRPAWLIPLLLLVLVALILLLLSRCGGDDDSDSPAVASTTAASTPSPTVSATPEATATGAAGDTGGTAGTIAANGTPLLPLADATKVGPEGDLSAYTGTDAVATAIEVQSVPADEGFWVGSAATDRVWIQLTGRAGESPFTVKQGDAVSFTGKVVENASGFAKDAGVTDAEGKTLLNSQGQHISVAKSALKLAP